jgi:hypothetical protein
MGLLFVGDDWAQDHHDVYLMDMDGKRLAGGRLPESNDQNMWTGLGGCTFPRVHS